MDYLKGALLIALLWTIDPILDMVCVGLIQTDFQYLDIFKSIVSVITTLVIFVTALIKYKKEKDKWNGFGWYFRGY